MSTFRLTILIIFGAFILVGVTAFALFQAGPSRSVTLSVWGSLPDDAIDTWIEQAELGSEDLKIDISYRQVESGIFYNEFIEALASNRGPDILLLDNQSILRFRSKLARLPFDFYNERVYRDSFIPGADIFIEHDGILALPFAVDPLITYWNETLFVNAGRLAPPSYWHEMAVLAEELTVTDGSERITRAAVPLGEFDNINNAKEILSALMMQAGTPIVTRDANGVLRNVMGNDFGLSDKPADMALDLYTRFSDPRKTFYSWNRSMPSSRQVFLAGDAALYFGFASELESLRERNPNLDFDVARFPQAQGAERRLTYGRMYAMAAVANSANLNTVASVMRELSAPQNASNIANLLAIAPTHKTLLSETPQGAFAPLFYQSAIEARSWLEPAGETADIFRNMVQDVTSGRSDVDNAVGRASTALTSEVNKFSNQYGDFEQ